jgi:hypothetical protein
MMMMMIVNEEEEQEEKSKMNYCVCCFDVLMQTTMGK